MEGTAYRTHPLRRTPTSLVDAACHSRQTWHALRNRIEIPQSYVRRADDLAFEFKTKLPELLKVILPFSYFLCYQYGVTSRPYALMIAAMLLIAINWNNRNTKPWPVILSMMLLCATSSYGLAIAGMLALNWTIQFLCGERSLIKKQAAFRGTCSATGIRHHTAPRCTPRTRHIPR